MAGIGLGYAQCIVNLPRGLPLESLWVVDHSIGKFGHMGAVRDGKGGVAMNHGQVILARELADELALAHDLLRPVHRRRINKDGVVPVGSGRLDIEVGHIPAVEIALGFTHLIPLGIVPLGRMNAAKFLHSQEEDEFKGGNVAAYRPA